jgi:hypothetical protein
MQITPAETGWTGLSGIVGVGVVGPADFGIIERDGDVICDRFSNEIVTRSPPFALRRLIESFVSPDGLAYERSAGYFSPRRFGDYSRPDGSSYDRPVKDDNKTQGPV